MHLVMVGFNIFRNITLDRTDTFQNRRHLLGLFAQLDNIASGDNRTNVTARIQQHMTVINNLARGTVGQLERYKNASSGFPADKPDQPGIPAAAEASIIF